MHAFRTNIRYIYIWGLILYITGDITTPKIYEKKENKKEEEEIKKVVDKVVVVIAENFGIDRKDISTEEFLGWIYVFRSDKYFKYEICRFGLSPQEISIYFNNDGVKDAGLGEITKESAEVMANDIKNKIPNVKKIHIFSEKEGIQKVLYPPVKDPEDFERAFKY